MKKLLIIPFLLLSLIVSAQDKWYIATTGSDSHGKGTIADPWLTLKHACDTVTGANFVGDTIMVGVGTFTETSQSALGVGMSIKGAGVTSVLVMTYTSLSSSAGCIQLQSGTEGTDGNQSISHLKIDGDLTGTTGIVVYCRKNVSIHDITMVDFDQCGIHFRGGIGAVATTKATGNQVYNCDISNSSTRGAVSDGLLKINNQSGMLIHDNILRQTGKASGSNGNILDAVGGYNEGLKYYNNKSYKNDNEGTEWNFHIEEWNGRGGNEIYDNEFHGGGTAIDLGGDSNTKGTYAYSWWIHDNLIEQTSLTAQAYRYNIGIDLERNVKDAIIERNHFKNYNWGVYFSCDGYSTNLGSDNVKIRYNIFEAIGTTDNVYAAAVMISSQETSLGHSNIDIDNNTMTAGTAFNVGAGVITAIYTGTLENVRIRNNITKGFYAGPIWIAADVDPDTVYYQNNQLNNTSNAVYYSAGRAITTLVTSGNQTGDPLFKSATDLHLQPTSPCINAGIDVGLTTDYAGHHKYGAAWDIGAYEYGIRYLVDVNGKLVRNSEGKFIMIEL
jgi:hypothetical protein